MPLVEIDPRAEEEARAAFLWYLDRSENTAAGSQRDFELTVQRIAEAPTAWPAVDGELHRCLFDRFPYALIYSIGPTSLRVIAVAHQPYRHHCSQRRGRATPIVSPEQRSLMKYALDHAQGVDGSLFLPWQNVRRDLAQACDRAAIEPCTPALRTTCDAPAPPGCAKRAPRLT